MVIHVYCIGSLKYISVLKGFRSITDRGPNYASIGSNLEFAMPLDILEHVSQPMDLIEVHYYISFHYYAKQIAYRRIDQIDINKFKTNVSKSQLITNPKLSADSLYKQFHVTLSSILNTHAPLKTKSVSPKPPNPWITSAIQAAKRTQTIS